MTTDYGYSEIAGTPAVAKTEGETIRLVFQWAARLDGETISSDTWELPDGLTNEATDSNTSDSSERWIRLSGGDDGRTYEVRNLVVTSGSRTLEMVKRVVVRDGG